MPPADNDQMNTEMRVRRALGLDGTTPRASQHHTDPSRSRRRFVQDGEVPVVVVHNERRPDGSPQNGSRIAELETALDSERTARAALSRALDEARTTVQSLQTRLTHAELAFAETLASEQRGRAEAESALQALQAVRSLPPVRHVEIADSSIAAPDDHRQYQQPQSRKPQKELVAKTPAVRKPKAAPKVKQPRSVVVKWWAPGFRVAKAAP